VMANGKVLRAVVVVLVCAGGAAAQNSYTETNLASDIAGMALSVDPNMINPWGMGRSGGTREAGAWWVSDSGSGDVSFESGYTGYEGEYLTVPPASGSGVGTPAGACFFAQINTVTTLDGTVQQHLTGHNVTNIVINNAANGAVYTACTEWYNSLTGPWTLYLANNAGGVEAYDTHFNPVALAPGAFTDPNIPAGFAPYGLYTGIVPQGAPAGRIWVSFFNGTPGAGQGHVDAFDRYGNLVLSLQQGSWMNQPYGMTVTPASGFGAAKKALLVAMTGSGMIAVFNPSTGAFYGFLNDSSGQPLVIPGIRGLGFGAGNLGSGPTTTLYFTAGIDGFTHGLFGSITAN
jgi:uncharacterized protein (TIGR03118 family)